MSQNIVKSGFLALGNFLSTFPTNISTEKFAKELNDLVDNAIHYNNWFTKENVLFAIENWAMALQEDTINQWLFKYDFGKVTQKKVAIILAGNIPMVGFHDFLSVLISGHKVLVKLSSNDQHLIQFMAKYLQNYHVYFKDNIEFVAGKLENYDAVIATGSNNTARYFDYYFGKVPNIIRKNRNSIAILTGNETKEQLTLLGEDIFRYFGLGCRNVSKLFVPKDYNFNFFFEAIFSHQEVIHYEKYANNYDYNKAVFLMSLFKLLDNGFLTLKEDTGYASPISSIFYEFYENTNDVFQKLEKDKDQIQCIVSNNLNEKHVYFGQTQKPNLWDYADDIDTISFLINL
jgi:Acyl-CoA reductase (LuxC)